MDRPAPDLRLEAITPPRQDIMRIWRTLRPVDHAFIQGIIGDMVMFVETPVDWIFLRTAAEFWDPEHAVFNFQGTELAPTIEEYAALIQRPTPTTHGIFVPNPFTTIQGLGTFGSAHGHLDLLLRSPMSPTLHRAVAGARVPAHFPRTAAAASSRVCQPVTLKPSLATPTAASPTLFLLQRG
ncbi:hypothetical protein CRG98_041228 [Punica granatum]|uniref:DUF7745 domain-containing protein n=1 Tax=Punica granatum TaxID=22663 RepID=A0A2I0I3G9_PUNGR|nr:hypothetical protein CRG98_041228 [Punica granatum]